MQITWQKFCGGHEDTDGTTESCVEFAEQGDTVLVRNSNDPNGPVIPFTRAEVDNFTEGWRNR